MFEAASELLLHGVPIVQHSILSKEIRCSVETSCVSRWGPGDAPRKQGSEKMAELMDHPVRGNRVRELRENKLMTQAQLARKAKVALRTIHSVEKGMNCRMDTKRKILLALGLRFEDKDVVFPPKYPLPVLPSYNN